MSANELSHEGERSNDAHEHGLDGAAFRNEDLFRGGKVECDLSAATSKLMRKGILPQLELDNHGAYELTISEWLRLFEKLEGDDKDSTVRVKEFNRSGPGEGAYNSPEGDAPGPPADEPCAPVRSPHAPADASNAPVDSPSTPADAHDAPGDVPRATPAQVEELFRRVENQGASESYMQELKNSLAQLPSSVIQAAIDGRTRIVALGQGPAGLGGTYSSATNTVTMYESGPFETRSTLAAEMFHNWDLNPFVGKHISSQPWFQDAFQRARASGIDTGDNTLTSPFEFIHHMAKYYSGSSEGQGQRLMDYLGAEYRELTRQALLS